MKRILIIDDEELILNFLERRIKREEVDVDIARDGREAMRLIDQHKYSLIISDLMMPFVSGFELINKIRSHNINHDTPILIVSGLSTEDTIVNALSVGANDFLQKPFAVNVLMAKVKKFIGDDEEDLANAS